MHLRLLQKLSDEPDRFLRKGGYLQKKIGSIGAVKPAELSPLTPGFPCRGVPLRVANQDKDPSLFEQPTAQGLFRPRFPAVFALLFLFFIFFLQKGTL